MSGANPNVVLKLTGGYLNSVTLTDIPGVQSAFNELLARIQALPFVPATWSSDVRAMMALEDNKHTWQPQNAVRGDAWLSGKLEPAIAGIPDWLSTPQARKAWGDIADWWRERLMPVLQKWARNEQATMEAAVNDAAFWDGLYKAVKPVAMVGNVILKAPEAAAGAVAGVAGGVLARLFPLIVVVAVIGVAVLIYKNKLTK